MRYIHLEDGLRLRFPARTEEFNQGVEIGMAAVLMDQGADGVSRWISRGTLGQLEAIAKQFGYRIETGNGDESWVEVTFRYGLAKARPHLKLVYSAS